MTIKHGTYEAGIGYYDASIKGWVSDAAKLTQSIPRARELGEGDRQQVAAWGKRSTFKPNNEHEQMLRLRDSDRQEDRENYQRLAKGRRRIEISDYDERRQQAIADGTWKPEA